MTDLQTLSQQEADRLAEKCRALASELEPLPKGLCGHMAFIEPWRAARQLSSLRSTWGKLEALRDRRRQREEDAS